MTFTVAPGACFIIERAFKSADPGVGGGHDLPHSRSLRGLLRRREPEHLIQAGHFRENYIPAVRVTAYRNNGRTEAKSRGIVTC